MSAIRSTIRISTTGMTNRAILGTLVFAICDAMNRFKPTGGVNIPIARLTIMMIPKCTGSNPKLSAIGKRIRVKIGIAAAACKHQNY
jgi:hypothetical protein